jgi:hypothetical protein
MVYKMETLIVIATVIATTNALPLLMEGTAEIPTKVMEIEISMAL